MLDDYFNYCATNFLRISPYQRNQLIHLSLPDNPCVVPWRIQCDIPRTKFFSPIVHFASISGNNNEASQHFVENNHCSNMEVFNNCRNFVDSGSIFLQGNNNVASQHISELSSGSTTICVNNRIINRPNS